MKSPPPQEETDQSRVTVLQSSDQLPVCEFSTGAVLPKRSDRQPVPHLPLDTAKKGSLSLASDCKTRSGHPISENTQETSTITFNDLSGENTDLSDTESDTTSLNVQNNQRSQTVLMLNNNHEDGLNISISEHQGETRPPPPPPHTPLRPFCPPTVSSAEDISVGHHSASAPIVCPNTLLTPPPETLRRRTVLVNTDSVDSGSVGSVGSVGSDLQKQACDSSPSGADNMSSLSLSTESLESYEEESHRHKGVPHAMGYPDRCGFLGHGYESYPGQRGTGDWEETLALPDDENGERVLDSLLSEILSPVDEVLSYGSAELPPSARGAAGSVSASLSLGLPPAPPAFEIITWTSEEDLPPPPTQELDHDQGPGEDPSIASEHIPPLPPDSPMPPPPPPPPLPPPRTPPGSSVPAEGVDSFHCHYVEIVDDDEAEGGGDDEDDGGKELSGTVPLQDLSSENEDSDQSENTTSLPVDEGNDMSDPLSSFHIGDRVLVCRSRPGVLRFKGPTAFASGTWAGVELDGSNGNHDGTFRGVKYFTCERNRGVLVRAEDLSHLSREPGSDLDTGLDEDPFSDEEPPRGSKLPHSEEQTRNLFSAGTTEQERGRTQNSSSTDSSAQTCGDGKQRHSLQASEAFPQSRCPTFRKGISLVSKLIFCSCKYFGF